MTSFNRMIVACLLAVVSLSEYNLNRIDGETLALGSENQAAFEQWKDRRITAGKPSEIAAMLTDLARNGGAASEGRDGYLLWLGNSQLHTINQYKLGEHLSPYWLAEKSCAACSLPLGVSLPNANIQEHFLLSHFVMAQLPVRRVVLKIVYDDMREDGLRDEAEVLLTPGVREQLGKVHSGQEILAAWDGRKRLVGGEGGNSEGGLHGFAQKHIEDRLVAGLASIFPLWADRANLRSVLMNDLYVFRNWVFGIKPQTVRRKIQARYDRNMRAFKDLALSLKEKQIPLLVYIAPIRNDVPLPYVVADYRAWIKELEQMSGEFGYRVVNLEELVPNELWGSIRNDDIDFMHFRGKGHVIMADRIWAELERDLAVPPAIGKQ